MNNNPRVESFVTAVCSRLNRHRLLNTALWSVAIGAAVMVAVALSYIIRGYSVPPVWYAILAALTLSAAIAASIMRRASAEHAAEFADEFFGLQDSVISCRHFAQSGKEGGFYDLQSKQTETNIDNLEPSAIKYQLPRRVFGCALMLVVIAAVLGFKSPSPAVQERLALEEQTLEQTETINKQLEELIDELEKETEGTDEEELVEPNQLRKWVDELKETKDRKEALRQYARLEQKLNEASARLQQKRDEQLLDRAADELDKDRATKDLAETLEQKKYEKAVEELKEFEPKQPEKKEGLREQLSQQRKDMARLKSAAHRMSTAAQALRRDKPNQGRQLARLSRENKSQGLSSKNSGGQSGSSGKGSQGESGELDDAIQDLEEAVEEWEDALDEAELEEAELGECKEGTFGKCEKCKLRVGDKLDELGKKMYRLALKKKAQKRIKKLCRACSQCQSGMCQGNGPNPGGKKAGWGTNDATRDERDELVDNGQYAQLKGIKGKGPSITTVEAAEDGDGVSTRRHVQRSRTFRRQVESFVQREDVPENVKAGVKEYFKNIHQAEEK